MTEYEFWGFLKQVIAVNGQMDQVSGYIDSDNHDVCENNRYIGGHSVLFNGHVNLSEGKIEEMGALLFDKSVSIPAKEAILILLAHYPKRCALNILLKYNKNPDKNLAFYAETALWECEMWNE